MPSSSCPASVCLATFRRRLSASAERGFVTLCGNYSAIRRWSNSESALLARSSSHVRLLVIIMLFLHVFRSLVESHSSVSVHFVTDLMSSSQWICFPLRDMTEIINASSWGCRFNFIQHKMEPFYGEKLVPISQFDIPAPRAFRLPNKAVNWLRLGMQSRFSAPHRRARRGS